MTPARQNEDSPPILRFCDFPNTGKSISFIFLAVANIFQFDVKIPKCEEKTKIVSDVSVKRYFDFQRCLLGEDFWSTILN